MSYTKRRLLSNENIVFEGKMSGWYFFPTICTLIISLILFIIGQTNTDQYFALVFLGAVLAFISIIKLIIKYWEKLTSEFIITDKRCILKKGFIKVSLVDMPLDKCEGIAFSQGFWGRILHYGMVTTVTTGVKATFAGLERPIEFRNKLNEQMDYYKKH